LNERGMWQAQKTGAYLKKYRTKNGEFDAMYSSPMVRAVETAEIMKEELDFQKDLILLEELKEIKSGKFSGTTAKVRGDDPSFSEFNDVVADAEKILDPIEKENYFYNQVQKVSSKLGLETVDERRARVKRVLDVVLASPYEKIIIVTHSGIINAMLGFVTNSLDPCQGNMDNGTNCSISYIKYINGKFFVITWPNTKHLGMV